MMKAKAWIVCLLMLGTVSGLGAADKRLINVAPGWAKNSVNVTVFRQNSLVSGNGLQFIAFYDSAGYLTLGKRALKSKEWELKKTRYRGHVSDAHNGISIMLDGKGYLHASFDHHGNKLNYAVSEAPYSLNLSDLKVMTGEDEGKVTYPQFYRMPNGNLIFMYRSGASGNGNLVLNSYDVEKGEWKKLQRNLIDGEGERNAYWQACVDKKGTIHLSWVWRETGDVSTNHDLCYAKSEDGGVTWEKSDGEKYDLPITAKTAEYVCRIPQNSELINQTSMTTDDAGRPYIATYWKDAGTEIPQYHVLYYFGNKWNINNCGFRRTTFSLSGGGTKSIPISRPQIIVKGEGSRAEVSVFFRDRERNDRVSVAVCKDLEKNRWELSDLTNFSVGAWEPSYDTQLWCKEKKIDLFVQKAVQADAEGTENVPAEEVRVLEFQPFAFDRPFSNENYEQKAREIVDKMTLDEKISQLHGTETKDQFRIVLGVKRLNIPDLPLCNGPAGMGPAGKGHEGPATALPAPISLAATWDTTAARINGEIAGSESAGYGNILLESPDVNIARTPHNGRTFEGFGEDPFLSGKIAAWNIKGIQSQGVMANVKHYAANNQETHRGSINEIIDERSLHEIYLPAFEAAVKEGKVASIMAAYNQVNGQHCTENEDLLNRILKGEWKFKGFVTSDFGAVHSTIPCAENGLDLELPGGKYFGNALKQAVSDKKIKESLLDEKLVRRFSTMMRWGVWDRQPERKNIPEEHALLARRLGEEGIVLLKNEQEILPLHKESIRTLALIGPYSKKASTGGGGSSYVTPFLQASPEEGMRQLLGSEVEIRQYDGANLDSALNIAKSSDAVVLMLGDHQTEGQDHAIRLKGNQDSLAFSVLAACPSTVVVLKTGGPVLMPWVDRCKALLEAWYPGEEDGAAVADVLFGETDPSGKLPITFPKTETDTPLRSIEQYPGVNGTAKYSEGIFVGYRWFDWNKVDPLFPFGYGLSYTKFSLENCKVSMKKGSRHAVVSLKISNKGQRAGAEVVQVYVGLPSTKEVPQAPYQLKGFERVELSVGETKELKIPLDERAFSYWNVKKHGWELVRGKIKIYVGTSSGNLNLSKTIEM